MRAKVVLRGLGRAVDPHHPVWYDAPAVPHVQPLLPHLQCLAPAAQLAGNLHLRCSTTSNQGTLLCKAADDAQRIVQGALRLLQHQLVAAAQQHRCGAARRGDAGDFDDLALAHLGGGEGTEDRRIMGWVSDTACPPSLKMHSPTHKDAYAHVCAPCTAMPCRTSTSSTSSALANFSGRIWSMCATGRQPSVLLINSMSSRSMSRTTMILALACIMVV